MKKKTPIACVSDDVKAAFSSHEPVKRCGKRIVLIAIPAPVLCTVCFNMICLDAQSLLVDDEAFQNTL
jgi:hypothetical protein